MVAGDLARSDLDMTVRLPAVALTTDAPARRFMPYIPFVVGFVVMLVVAGISLTSVPLDWDEGATLSASTRSLPELFELARHKDAVITPYYLLLHVLTTLFGQSDVVLRLPSLVAMAAGAGVTAELGRRVAGQAAGIVAGVICAIVPSIVLLATDARPYGLAFLFATLSSLLLLIAIRTPTWWRCAVYGLAVALTATFHLVTAAVLAGHAVIVVVAWWKDRDKRLIRVIPVVAAALLAVAPLVQLGRGQHQSQLSWVAKPTWRTLVALPGDIAHSQPVGYVLIGLAVAAFAALTARRYVELIALVLAPIATILSASLIAPVWIPRYGVFLWAPLAVLAAATITSGDVRAKALPRLLRTVVLVGALAFLALPAQSEAQASRKAPDTRAMATAIHDQARAGDVIVYSEYTWAMRPTLKHYLDELDWGATPQPPDALLKRTAAQTGTLEALEVNDIKGALSKARRIWLVSPAGGDYGAAADPLNADGWSTQYVRYKIKYIGSRYKVLQSQTFTTGRAVLLVPRTPA
jgi:mannosyltransferase